MLKISIFVPVDGVTCLPVISPEMEGEPQLVSLGEGRDYHHTISNRV